ncbi:MAG: hypothetical protein M1510_11550 [Nitrospirae bacterium]|nr:hypothetical protein [Nitrospirota bacterium]MCL5238440.1 hypothetical protein [Nitrospirota bacterium]
MRTPLVAGRLSEWLTPRTVLLIGAAALFTTVLLGYRAWMDTSLECVRCHADKSRMERLNAPWAYMTDEIVRKESRHRHIECRDCHLGNGRARDKDKAHKDMLKMLIVSENGTLEDRKTGYPYGLSRTGDNLLTSFLPKLYRNGAWYPLPVRNILWHDRDPETFDFDPGIAEKTCGKGGCHPRELEQFKTSHMGHNYRQRTMQTWLIPYGPHNCGPSFADKPPSGTHERTGFDFSNTRRIGEEMNVPFSREQAKDKQKFCNICHAGCLDCHYTPGTPGNGKGYSLQHGGAHVFTRAPLAENCAGFSRGNTSCHPGAMHSRRGETYLGGDYSVPGGMAADIHYKNKKRLSCIECHPTGEGGMGHIERKASCQDCHLEIEAAHAGDVHKNMDCAACHIKELRGYQITVWGPGQVAGKDTPFNKYSLYYGTQSPPILIKDRKGMWMPVKIWPHSLGNVKKDVLPSKGIRFRWPDGETRDAYYVAGTFTISREGIPPSAFDNKHLLWLEIEQAAHPFGPARGCPSCHSSSKQLSVSHWEFEDAQGAEPFTGGYRIVADKKGIRIENLRATSPIELLPGYKLADFASWLYLKDKWKMPGDFSIKTDPGKYRKYHKISGALKERIKLLDARSGLFDKKSLRRYRELRASALHNPEEGLRRLEKEFP